MYHALALDGAEAPIDSLTSNAAPGMWTGIVTDEHAELIVERLWRATWTAVSACARSHEMTAYNPMSYHNGSVWPHDTALGVAGLMRYAHIPGAVELAHRLANGLIEPAMSFEGGFPSFSAVSRGRFRLVRSLSHVVLAAGLGQRGPFMLVRSFLGLHPTCRTAGSSCPRCCRGPGAVSR